MASNPQSKLAGPTRPLGSPEIPQFFLPGGSGAGTYSPRLYGAATIHFGNKQRRVDETRQVAFIVPLEAGMAPLPRNYVRNSMATEVGLRSLSFVDRYR